MEAISGKLRSHVMSRHVLILEVTGFKIPQSHQLTFRVPSGSQISLGLRKPNRSSSVFLCGHMTGRDHVTTVRRYIPTVAPGSHPLSVMVAVIYISTAPLTFLRRMVLTHG